MQELTVEPHAGLLAVDGTSDATGDAAIHANPELSQAASSSRFHRKSSQLRVADVEKPEHPRAARVSL